MVEYHHQFAGGPAWVEIFLMNYSGLQITFLLGEGGEGEGGGYDRIFLTFEDLHLPLALQWEWSNNFLLTDHRPFRDNTTTL